MSQTDHQLLALQANIKGVEQPNKEPSQNRTNSTSNTDASISNQQMGGSNQISDLQMLIQPHPILRGIDCQLGSQQARNSQVLTTSPFAGLEFLKKEKSAQLSQQENSSRVDLQDHCSNDDVSMQSADQGIHGKYVQSALKHPPTPKLKPQRQIKKPFSQIFKLPRGASKLPYQNGKKNGVVKRARQKEQFEFSSSSSSISSSDDEDKSMEDDQPHQPQLVEQRRPEPKSELMSRAMQGLQFFLKTNSPHDSLIQREQNQPQQDQFQQLMQMNFQNVAQRQQPNLMSFGSGFAFSQNHFANSQQSQSQPSQFPFQMNNLFVSSLNNQPAQQETHAQIDKPKFLVCPVSNVLNMQGPYTPKKNDQD